MQKLFGELNLEMTTRAIAALKAGDAAALGAVYTEAQASERMNESALSCTARHTRREPTGDDHRHQHLPASSRVACRSPLAVRRSSLVLVLTDQSIDRRPRSTTLRCASARPS